MHRLLLVAFLVALAIVEPGTPDALARPPAGGWSPHSLALTVTVNTRRGLGAMAPGIRAGDPVVVVYRVGNRGEADLHDVTLGGLGGLGALGGAPQCDGSLRLLRALTSVTCTARFRAAPGVHVSEVVARASVADADVRLTTDARVGYLGIANALQLSEQAHVVVTPHQVVVQYLISNQGSHTVTGISLTDVSLRPAAMACAGAAPVIPALPPGKSVVCVAAIRRVPGSYRSTGRVSGRDGIATLGASGALVPPPLLTAQAATAFTIPAPPPAVAHVVATSRGPVRRPAARPGVVAHRAPTAGRPGTVGTTSRAGGSSSTGGKRPTAGRPPAISALSGSGKSGGSLFHWFARHIRTPLGVASAALLFLLLLPAAIAGVVLGTRRR